MSVQIRSSPFRYRVKLFPWGFFGTCSPCVKGLPISERTITISHIKGTCPPRLKHFQTAGRHVPFCIRFMSGLRSERRY